MFRKLRPLSAIGLKTKKSHNSLDSVQSRNLGKEENQLIIPGSTQNQDHPRSPKHATLTSPSDETVERSQPSRPCEHQNEASADSLESRYRSAMREDQTNLNLAKELGEETPLKTTKASSSTSSSESNFNWNETDESELDESKQAREKRKLSKAKEIDQSIRHAKRLRRFYLFLMKFSTPVRTAIIGVLGSGIAITPAILVWLRFTDLSARKHILAWSIWLSISFAASCATSITVDILPAIAIKLFDLLYGAKPEKLKTQIELWMNVRYWTKVALGLTCYWVVLSIMFSRIFHLYKEPQLAYFDWIWKVAAGLFTAGVVLLVEKILLQVIQLNFHRTSLKDRLEENERALWALDRLAAAKGVSHSPKRRNSKFLSNLTHHRTRSGRRMARAKDSTVVDVPPTPKTPPQDYSGDKRTPETCTSSEMPSLRSAKEVESKHKRHRSSNLLTVTDHFASAVNSALKHGTKHATGGMVSSTHSAKKLAKKLFEGLDEDRGGVITPNEFEGYFKTASDAAMAFKLFDKDGNGDIDRKEMRNAVVRIYRERMALAVGLQDMSSAVSKLDAVLISLACLLTIFIWFFIFNSKGTSSQLVPMATIILGFSFIFGNAAKNLFESMLFIFSIHPYDVGDMVSIDKVYMFVTEFGLFSTTFQRVDGQVVVAPNSLLISKKHIINIRRSGAMWETTEIMVGFDTPLEVLHEFRARLRQYVICNPRDWKGGLDVNIDFINNQNLIQLIIAMEHKSNWQDWDARWDRRTLLMKEMKRIMDSLKITYKLPPQPISFLPQRPGPCQLLSRREDDSVQSQHPRVRATPHRSSTNATASRTSNTSRPFPNRPHLTSFRFPGTL